MKYRLLFGGLVAACLSASPSSAETINIAFENLASGEIVTNQYTGVTFSSVAGGGGVTLVDYPFSLGSSGTKFICSRSCILDVNLDFTRPVNELTFLAVGDNQSGVNGGVRVFGGTGLLGTVDILGDNVFTSPFLVDLRRFSDITRIELSNFDGGGLGFDDFNFSVGAGVNGVPEPATWATMILGFGAVGGSMRLRRRKSWTIRATA